MYKAVTAFPTFLSTERSEAVRRAEDQVLESLASGKPLMVVLDQLIEMMEAQMEGALGSVVLLDPSGRHIERCAAPRLPDHYLDALTGIPVGPTSGSCGTAAFKRELVIVEDIASDPLWRDFRDLAIPCGLRACWSQPIIEAPDKVLGTFAFYYTQPKLPSLEELAVVEAATAIARIALQLSRAQGLARLLSSAMGRLNDIIFLMDGDVSAGPRILYVNEAFERLSGYARHSIIGLRPRFLDEARPPEAAAKLRSVIEGGGPVSVEIQMTCADGSPVWLESQMSAIRDQAGTITHFVAVHRDISQKKKTEDSLRERERSLNTLLGSLPGMAYRRQNDEAWAMQYVSQGAFQLTGYKPEELMDAGTAFTDLIEAEDRETVRGAISASIERKDPYELSYRIRTRDGALKWVWERGQGVVSSDGNIRIVEGFVTDITERKFLEEQMIQTQRLEGIGTLAGGIAHDLNNILAPIVMATDLLKDRFDDPEVRMLLKAAAESADRGANLVKQILLFARGADGRRVSLPTPTVIEALSRVLENTLPSEIRIEVALQTGLGQVRGDPTQLQQALLNLCLNARDAMPSGGTLRIAVTSLNIVNSTSRPHPEAVAGEYVRIDISDTGIGIADHHRTRIFDPFFTTKDQGKGKGLGLPTSRAIVRSHAGFITLRSAPGFGSTFSVFLPVVSGPPQEAVAHLPVAGDPLPRGAGQRILVVDDEDTVRQIARTSLERFGYHVTTARDGVQAAGLLHKAPADVDLAIVDIQMPGLDGHATIVALRAIKPRLPVICSSGSTVSPQRSQIQSMGVRHFLDKPFSVETLVRTVHAALDTAVGPRF